MMLLQVGVKVLLKNKEGKVLLLRRSEEKYGKTTGSWDIVGGRIDPGSALIENLKREMDEETKLTLASTPRLIAAQDILCPDKHVVRLTYVAYTDGEPVLDLSENTEYQWMAFEEFTQHSDIDTFLRSLLDAGTLHADSWDGLE